MARKRQIDPGIWTSVQFFRLTNPWARILFIGCFSNADDDGRLKADPAYLKAIIYPADTFTDDEVRTFRDMVAEQGLIQIYHNGDSPEEYLYLPTFSKHQTVNKRYPSKLPPPTIPLPNHYGSTTTPLPHQELTTTTPLPGKSGVGSVSDLKSNSISVLDSNSISESESGTEKAQSYPHVVDKFVDNSPRPTDPTVGKPTLDKEKDLDDLESIDDYIKRLHTEFFGQIKPTPKTIPKIEAAITGISQFPDEEIEQAFEKAHKQRPPPKYPLAYVLKTLQDKSRRL